MTENLCFDKADILTDEEISRNVNEQQDEVNALEAIYGGDFAVLDGSSVPSCRVSIQVQLVEPLTISVVLPRDETDSCQPSLNPEPSVSHKFQVSHLPPLQLACQFPPTYPSRSAPKFQLSGRWLSRRQLSQLCQGLDEVCAELAGSSQVAVFSMADWLSREGLTHLGVDAELVLDHYSCDDVEGSDLSLDPRAVSESSSLENDVLALMTWHKERETLAFREALHECQVCLQEKPGVDFSRLSCGHHFCAVCLRSFSETHVADGSIACLACPDTGCRTALGPAVLRSVLSDSSYSRWEQLTLQRSLDAMADVAYCPRCSSPCLEDKDYLAQCASCFYAFCGLCCASWHAGSMCMDADAQLRVLQARQLGGLASKEQLLRERRLRDEVLSEKYLLTEAKSCPRCNTYISKTDGCNKMTCFSCQSYFCWLCGQLIKGYDHFQEGCQLFEEENLSPEHPHGRVAPGAIFGRMVDQAFVARHKICPSCGQENMKVDNNNHMACWNCRNHFCALCLTVVKSSIAHYGPKKKCQQHSDVGK